MGWDKDAAVDYLVKHAGVNSLSECATFTRRAIAAGGSPLYVPDLQKIMVIRC